MTLPEDFTLYTRELMGAALFERYMQALDVAAPVSIRINPFKAGQEAPCLLPPPPDGVGVSRVGWCPEGFYLPVRPNFTFDPLLHAGLYYVQEASSMFVSHVVRSLVHEPVMMLDLCAAPGGKSTAVRAALPEGSLLMANEPMKQRASILTENVKKFGHPDMMVTCNYPRDYREAGLRFDVILADVPCSGEGMFRKDEGAVAEWSPQNVEQCRTLQRSIIQDVWPCLREGGLLIYSTCTYNAHEDEANVAWIAETLGAEAVEVPTEAEWGIVPALRGSLPAYRFIPGQTQGEGLFMAVLRKKGQAEPVLREPTGGRKKEARRRGHDRGGSGGSAAAQPDLGRWLRGNFVMTEQRGVLTAVPAWWAETHRRAADALHLLHAGVTVGTRKGRDLIPDASLALSTALADDAFARVDLDYTSAVSYLRKDALVLPADAPRGMVLMTYQGAPLGFAKNVGNRANNHYPQEWKIRSSHAPEEPVRVLRSEAAF